ncbi:transcription elongation factor 1-like protein [Pyrus ussuriensis x Pyrus communis]|uniref:Transcription elongation factor 1 homolog n=1 Tax=Pyrus ussuriensis x Pyrus communis TaxID=2448454 RepID=A0A5N5I988_9ROSA|nr:transcription elongation factor 1-like protein [Pyrus ussuriensis x Pyrus communis]
MGNRKSSAKPPPKKWNDKLNTVLNYLFYSHDTSVECRIDMKNLIGKASCRICQENFSTTIIALSEPIDVYSEWIDESEAGAVTAPSQISQISQTLIMKQ